MNGYGPTLQATGGGLGAFALFWGISTGTWLVVAVAIVAIAITCYSFYRLRSGEIRLRK